MYRELTLKLPDSLLFTLENKASEQGVSLEALCLSLLSERNDEGSLTDPNYYGSLNLENLRKEVHKVIESGLPREEVRKRLNTIDFYISKRYIR